MNTDTLLISMTGSVIDLEFAPDQPIEARVEAGKRAVESVIREAAAVELERLSAAAEGTARALRAAEARQAATYWVPMDALVLTKAQRTVRL